jgi:hypothetical protein
VENVLRRLVNEMRVQRCQVAAVYVEPVDDDDANGDGTPSVVCASVVVAIISRSEMGTPLSLNPDVLLAALSTATNPESGYRELEVPEIVDFPVGRVVRTRRLQKFDAAGSDMFVEMYVVPVEPDYEYACMVQFATPSLDIVGEFSELFTAIASTFALYREGEPTPA